MIFSKMASKMAARYGKMLEKGIYQPKLMITVSMKRCYICSWLLSTRTWCFYIVSMFQIQDGGQYGRQNLENL